MTGLLAHATPAGERAAITCIYLLSIGAEIPFCAMEASSCIADRPTQNAEVELLLRVSNTQGSLNFLSSAIYEFAVSLCTLYLQLQVTTEKLHRVEIFDLQLVLCFLWLEQCILLWCVCVALAICELQVTIQKLHCTC